MKSLNRSLALNIAGVVAVALTGFVAMLVLARKLPVDAFGTVSIVLMVANAVAVFDGVRPVIIYEATRTDVAIARLHRTVRMLFLAIGAIAAVLTLALAGSLWFEALGAAGVLMLGALVFLYFPAACNWGFLDARQDTGYTGVARSAAWLAVYLSYVVIAHFSFHPVAFLIPLLAMNATLALVYSRRLGRLVDGAGNRSPSSREIVLRSLDNLGVNFAATTIGTFDRIALSAVAGMHGVGLYSARYELSTKPAAFFRVLNAVLLPAAASTDAQGDRIEGIWLRLVLVGSQILTAVAAAAVAARHEIVMTLLGPEYAPHADVFGLLIIGLVFQFFGYACPVLLNARGNFSLQRTLYLIAAVTMIASAVPVARAYGIVGLAALYALVRTVDLALFVATLTFADIRPRGGFIAIPFLIGAAALTLAWTSDPMAAVVAVVASGSTALLLMRIVPARLQRP